MTASLRAVQAFCAVARCGSMVEAAVALGVTPSALSHLVRGLEARLGVPLFERAGRGMALNEDGRTLLAAVGPAMATVEEALAAFVRRRVELRISTLSTFATRWLIPRLARFQERHPDVELLVSTSTRVVDFARESFDCAIRWGEGGWPGVACARLYDEELVPACSPALTARGGLRRPAELAGARMLHARSRRDDWRRWLAAAGVEGVDTEAGPVFDTRNLVIQAAIGQMGVAVVDPRFIAAELAAGQLVLPFGPAVPLPTGYWLAWPPGRGTGRPLAAFRAWLAEELT
ncbi:LysR substrate-binding domain-containing protein [Azospirillum sp. ST 5-10]|uniref:LysR substrate-binding domain-containing protein n=1 Tax=unclassified Azospirillum TaxID=2630922 RepID=UPI003F49B531